MEKEKTCPACNSNPCKCGGDHSHEGSHDHHGHHHKHGETCNC